jgi:hypothetical protein
MANVGYLGLQGRGWWGGAVHTPIPLQKQTHACVFRIIENKKKNIQTATCVIFTEGMNAFS